MPNEVDVLLATLDHPQHDAMHALRRIILQADPRIGESVKWNAPSFHTAEHFATFHLRAKTGFQLVLHLGAKGRPDATVRATVPDPHRLLQWKSADRATIALRDLADVDAKRDALTQILRHWIEEVN
ncbi:DUF1801 domain-containing protein [Gemmatimonas sp.]|uniref:DUF1801 domain-containing protein n=1 Tax=Gemmatimonas sp. TaxID=1962908 RepID=UPI00286AF413|nr:DUF1801 domain-containing protein [Gemmatimonas sp.]